MKYNIVSGVSQQFYHSIPSDLDLIQTAPTREAIFQMLSQIPFNKFPEFVADILVRIHKHTLEDVTDGQGDEKQDILTITPEGNRCLTQCKHTINYKEHHNGDELDVMMGACLRKDCLEAHYVTNSDLTPQGKKYINDKEYQRGWKADLSLCPKIDYWNGHDIWEKIKNDNVIINKWFSGLGQVHGLRSFKFDLTIQKFPYRNDGDDTTIKELIAAIKEKKWAVELQADMAYSVEFKNEYTVNIKRWFQFSGNLDINFVLPNDDIDFIHKPLYALTVEVIVEDAKKVYSHNKLREQIIKFIAKEALNNAGAKAWWHITSSQIKSNVFLHDINEPREIVIESAYTFIKYMGEDVKGEIEYCMLDPKKYNLSKNKDDDTTWEHKISNIKVQELFEQKFNPIEDYSEQVKQYYKAKEWKAFDFKAVSGIDSMMMMRVRQLLPMNWVALDKDNTDFIWGYSKETNKEIVDFTHKKVEALGVVIMQVSEEVKQKMLDAIKVDLTPRFYIHGDFKNLSFPIALNKRVFYLSKYIEFEEEISLQKRASLLVFKYQFENKYGHENMGGKTEVQYKEHELKGLLFNLMTFRGTRMLDIGLVKEKKIWLNIRYSENKIQPGNFLADYYIKEFMKTEKEIAKLILK